MVEITPIVGESKPDQVTRSLEELILSRRLRPGEQLPSQKELAERFNVGIRSIREAFKKLETRGLISVRQGKGVFVKADNLDSYVQSLTDSLGINFPSTKQMLLALTQVRSIIETAVVKDVATNPDPASVTKLREIVETMGMALHSSAFDFEEHQRLDTLFHMSIVEASKNLILIAFYKQMYRLLFSSMVSSGRLFSNMERGLQEHRAILTAIENRQPDAAVAGIASHLDHTRSILESTFTESGQPSGGGEIRRDGE
jgi:GntR family transcriptional regulator, transcriptional repressor for pyruvate dehydrogenase complex